MTTEVLAQSLTAGVEATFGQGRVWYIKSATAPLTIVAQKLGSAASVRNFINVAAGFKFTAAPGDGWDYLRVLSQVSQNIEIILSDDDVEVANAVSVTGAVTVQAVPASTVANTAPVVIATGTAAALFPANTSRRRVTVFADSNNAGSCFLRASAAGNNIGELQAGISLEIENTATLFARNDTGSSCTFYIFEET